MPSGDADSSVGPHRRLPLIEFEVDVEGDDEVTENEGDEGDDDNVSQLLASQHEHDTGDQPKLDALRDVSSDDNVLKYNKERGFRAKSADYPPIDTSCPCPDQPFPERVLYMWKEGHDNTQGKGECCFELVGACSHNKPTRKTLSDAEKQTNAIADIVRKQQKRKQQQQQQQQEQEQEQEEEEEEEGEKRKEEEHDAADDDDDVKTRKTKKTKKKRIREHKGEEETDRKKEEKEKKKKKQKMEKNNQGGNSYPPPPSTGDMGGDPIPNRVLKDKMATETPVAKAISSLERTPSAKQKEFDAWVAKPIDNELTPKQVAEADALVQTLFAKLRLFKPPPRFVVPPDSDGTIDCLKVLVSVHPYHTTRPPPTPVPHEPSSVSVQAFHDLDEPSLYQLVLSCLYSTQLYHRWSTILRLQATTPAVKSLVSYLLSVIEGAVSIIQNRLHCVRASSGSVFDPVKTFGQLLFTKDLQESLAKGGGSGGGA
jgi:hypothetical protein